MTRLVTRVTAAATALACTAVAILVLVAHHAPDAAGSSPDAACAAAPADAGTGDRVLALAGRTYDAFAEVIEAVSDRATAELWRSVFATCDGGGTFDPDGSASPG
jgi:hypothetical protein